MLTLNQFKMWQHSGHVVVCKGPDKKFKTNNSMNRHQMLVCGKPCQRKNLSKRGKSHRVKTTVEENILKLEFVCCVARNQFFRNVAINNH